MRRYNKYHPRVLIDNPTVTAEIRRVAVFSIKTLAAGVAACAYILIMALMVRPTAAAPVIKHVFIIAMENTDTKQIYGNVSAPYINQFIIPKYARAENFNNPLPIEIPSEPHYIWMEAGTNAFSDRTFLNNDDPAPRNSTASRDHLVTQIENSKKLSWITYQQGISQATGQCPIVSSFPYAAKHNPFVFFQDVSGNAPTKDNDLCKSHTKPYSEFETDLAANRMANYVFITPDLCNDMHGDERCPKVPRVMAGDRWLSAELPRIVEWVHKNSGVIFIVWDEGSSTTKIPFLAIGPGVKANYASSITFNHGSLVRTIEDIFELPTLPAVSKESNLADMFTPGSFP